MTARLVPLAAALLASLALAPAASAAPTPSIDFEHDTSLDGTPNEIQSGVLGLYDSDPNAQPAAQRVYPGADDDPNAGADFSNVRTYEVFEFEIAPGQENTSFTVEVGWAEADIDFDVYVYRQRPNGSYDPTPIASAASLANPERATYFSPIGSQAITPGRYAVYVDNWCSDDDDVIPVEESEGNPADNPCAGIDGFANEDDWEGNITFTEFVPANQVPRDVGLAGPQSAPVGQPVTFTGSAVDPDGQIAKYSFDLDGDGRFETDNARNPSVTKTFLSAGSHNIGVRVADDRGAVAYASYLFTATGPAPAAPAPVLRPLAARFSLNRPVFGGRKLRRLVVTYRVTEDVSAQVDVFRAGRLISRSSPRPSTSPTTTYRLLFSARNRKRGTYTVRLTLKAPDGTTQVERLFARRL